MRPIKLTVEGFTSFRTKQELDFTELDLFAITGATGAGKSSLLDAITYALYEKVPGKVTRKADIPELVSQGEQSLKVSFQFQLKQTEYKITRSWKDRRSGTKTNFLLDHLEQGQWQRCDRSVEDILGMDFDTFTRVIVLPQGQFDEFLKGSAAKRREILRNLGGLNIFEEMRQRASDRVKNAQIKLAEINGKIEGLELPTDAEITTNQTELETLEQNLPQLTEEVAIAGKLLEEEEKLLEQIRRLEKLQQNLAQINLKETEIEKLKQKLKIAQAANRLKSDWDRVRDIRQRFTKTSDNLQDATDKLARAKSELKTQQENRDCLQAIASEKEAQFDRRSQNLATAEAYSQQEGQAKIEFSQAQNKLQQKTKQCQEREVEVRQVRETVTKAQKKLETVNNTLAQTSPDTSRLEILDMVVPLIPQWETAVRQEQTVREKLDRTVKEKQQLQSEHTSSLEQLEVIEVKLQEAELSLEEAKASNDRFARKNHAAILRTALYPGDDCPVCGGKYPEAHLLPFLTDAEIIELKPLEKFVNNTRQNCQQAQTTLTQIITRLESLQKQETSLQQELKIAQIELSKFQNQIADILKAEVWDSKALKQEQKRLSEQNKAYQQALIQKQKVEAELERSEQSLEFCQNNIETAREELDAANAEVEYRQQLLVEIQDKLHQVTNGKTYDSLKHELERDKNQWKMQKQETDAKFNQAQNHFTQAETTYNNSNENFAHTKSQQEHLETQWQVALADNSFTEISFKEALVTETKQQEWQKEIASYTQQKIEATSRVREIKDNIGDRTTDEASLTKRREAKQLAEKKLEESREQKIELEIWLKNAATKQQQSQDLLERQQQVKQQEHIYQTLARDLQTNHFQAFILEHLERELVTRATVLLQDLTDSRYALKIENGEYRVEDNWNAGEMRGIRTLSGGETFAASLSMALSLSEKLSMGAEIGCLFLDEGFGTLDRETLDIVTRTLESLRQQDRLIGVITHIPALAEQFTQIKVQKSQLGSNLRVELC
ncbi:AAA family ATPase [Myxosarcina sp. GI1]|uniref:AAA family ATPase n=1 Tax=Myxosarcina sp. GI1 TaxID=1541065 RepID=UPI000559F1B9|nr:SMC family ATPase [Myxosarcina sp. GI1]